MRVFSRFSLPQKIREINLDSEVMITDQCEDFLARPGAVKILVLTPRGLLEAGRCRADFYARHMEDVYLWLKLPSSYRR